MTWASLLMAAAVVAAGVLVVTVTVMTPMAFGQFVMWMFGL